MTMIVLGIITLIFTQAASSNSASFEAESDSSSLTVVADGASGGKAIKFSNPGSLPPNLIDVTTQLPIIPSESGLVANWRNNVSADQCNPAATPCIPPYSADGEGAFRFICMPGQLLYDDPIVYPGVPGASHLHMFFGNKAANSNSFFSSLRKNGDSTCQGGTINRSAYWIPALINGSGKVILPNFGTVYYKGGPETINVPRGLQYIAGDAMGNVSDSILYGSPNNSDPGGYEFHQKWKCVTNNGNGSEYNFSDSIPKCQAGDALFAVVPFPYCWDGRLDAGPIGGVSGSSHRDHMRFPKRNNSGNLECPASHPQHIPKYTLQMNWSVLAGEDTLQWYLASDRMAGMTHANGTTLHADWLGAWDQDVMEIWVQECVRELRNCSGSVYGDGTIGKQPTPWNWVMPTADRLVNIPADPTP